jgi:hypothetical protein
VRPLGIVLTVLAVLVFAAPVLNALALRAGSWQQLGRNLLHVAHFDVDVRPNRETRRSMSPRLGSFYMLTNESGVVTLAQAKLNATDDLDVAVIDEFRKESYVLDNMPFDDVVNAAGGGATLTYGYTRLVTESAAAFRAINAEYTKSEATKQRITVDLKVFGGAFDIDRVLAGIARGAEVTLQMQQKIKAARALFHDAFINGDSAVDANSFDGLDKALTGTTTEFRPLQATDWTGINSESAAHDQLDALDEFLALLDGEADAILGNKKAIGKVRALARRAGYFTRDRNDFGRQVERYGNIVLVDMGDKPGSSSPIVPIETRDPDAGGAGGNVTGLTDLYAVRFGTDALHGISRAGAPLIQQWLPNFDEAGAVKTGEVEMVAATALKRTKAAGVFRNIKVQ